jgi:Ca2+-transporting ATPase
VLTGNDIDKLSSSQLSKIIHKYSVFARVTPEHKLKIVQALKEYGNIVSMTGDGVNDAPSIKTANIGVCMGQTGTDAV